MGTRHGMESLARYRAREGLPLESRFRLSSRALTRRNEQVSVLLQAKLSPRHSKPGIRASVDEAVCDVACACGGCDVQGPPRMAWVRLRHFTSILSLAALPRPPPPRHPIAFLSRLSRSLILCLLSASISGTPNLSEHARAIPATFWSAPWYRKPRSGSGAYGRQAVIPQSIYQSLSKYGQQVAADLASANEEADTSWAPDWDLNTKDTEHLRTPIPKL